MMKTSPQTHGLDDLLAFMLSERARPVRKGGRTESSCPRADNVVMLRRPRPVTGAEAVAATPNHADPILPYLIDRYFSPPTVSSDVSAEERAGADEPAAPLEGTDERGGRRRRPWWTWAGGGLVAAAAVVLTWSGSRPTPPSDRADPVASLPSYQIGWLGRYVGPNRDGSATPPAGCDQQLRVGDPLALRLRPSEQFHAEVEVAVLARSAEKALRWLSVDWEIGREGVLSVAPGAVLDLEPGRWTVTFFVAQAGAPLDPLALIDAPPGQHPGYTAVQATLCVVR
ncbi:MAG: hypothetical protein AAGF11_42415 [Myxococcota bacterium]